MTRTDKLIAQLLSCPSTYRYTDFLKVMASYGFEMDQRQDIRIARSLLQTIRWQDIRNARATSI